jgi:hypothetical protein
LCNDWTAQLINVVDLTSVLIAGRVGRKAGAMAVGISSVSNGLTVGTTWAVLFTSAIDDEVNG